MPETTRKMDDSDETNYLLGEPPYEIVPDAKFSELTPVEQETITLILEGRTSTKELAISRKRGWSTVRNVLLTLYRKFEISDSEHLRPTKAALILYLLENGYLQLRTKQ